MGDSDVGKQFLNYFFPPSLQPYFSMDLSPFTSESKESSVWETWTRYMMGLRSSPYVHIKRQLKATETVWGDQRNAGNPFKWDPVILNLSGTPELGSYASSRMHT